MRIGLIADMLDFGYRGVGVYAYNLIYYLLKLDKDNEYIIIHNEKSRCPEDHKDIFKKTKELKIKPFPGFTNKYETERLITRLKYPKVLKKERFDLIHDLTNLYALSPKKIGIKIIVTVHEVTNFVKTLIDKFAVFFTFRSLKTLKDNLEHCHFIAISENTKKDLLKYGIPEEKIDLVYQGVNHEVFKPIKCEKPEYPFILYVGSNAPRKNLSTLLKAFHILKEKGFPHKLLLVSHPNKKLINLINCLNIRGEVIFRYQISDQELCKLYNCADLFVLPSLFEGFGLPALEAMACGCPVIVSNVASLPEVVGDAGLTFNPLNHIELANKMEQVLTDEVLRKKMKRKGLKRARMFSWERTARETLEVYKKVSS